MMHVCVCVCVFPMLVSDRNASERRRRHVLGRGVMPDDINHGGTTLGGTKDAAIADDDDA